MKVELISYTQDTMNRNLLEQIAFVARVSNPSNQNNHETAEKLVNYLIKHKHWSPLEMVDVTLEIETTRDIARQILRHRSFVFQEFSQRYADPTQDLGFVTRETRLQDEKNRQNSIDDLNSEQVGSYYRRISSLFEESNHLYQEMVSNGVAKECARSILPLASPTRLYMQGSIRSWITYISLREKHGSQMEHTQIAKEVKEIFCEQLPTIAEAMGGMQEWEI